MFAFNECHSCRILAENILHESLKIKLSNLRPGPNTRQLCRAGINKIKDMIRKVGWVPQKGILYVIPTPEHAERCAGAFLDYDFSKVVSKVSNFPEEMCTKCSLFCSFFGIFLFVYFVIFVLCFVC